MKRKSNVERFTDSVGEFFRESPAGVAVRHKERIFNGELFIFCRQAGNRLGRSASSYTVLGGRHGRGANTCGTDLGALLGLDLAGRRSLVPLMDAGKSYVILPTDKGTAVIFCGLLRSCGMGLCFLTDYSPSAAFAASGEDHAHLFEDAVFSPYFDGGDSADADGFINFYLGLEQRLSVICGIKPTGGGDFIELVFGAAAALTECELSSCGGRAAGDSLDCESLVAFALCLLMAAYEIAVDRRVSVRHGNTDGGTLIEISCECVGDMTEEGEAFIEYCRAFSDRHSIPFSPVYSGGEWKVSFIPRRIDPSLEGLKAGAEFADTVSPMPDSPDARG